MKKILFYSVIVLFFASCEKPEDDNNNDDDIIPVERTLADLTLNWEKAWGTILEDDFAGAVIDNSGNLYFTGSSQPDGYVASIFITKVNLNNQQVEWTKSLDLDHQDYFPSPSENGHSQGGGGSRCISVDESGNIYIAGTTKQGFNEVFVVKVNSSGTVLWQQFWEADNSGLARGSAKAYALDVKNDKVYITGSTGAGTHTEEAMVFMLVLDASNGSINPLTKLGINPSDSYNDRGYSIKVSPNNDVFIAGWEGLNNSGFVLKYSNGGSTFEWYKRFDIGYGSRITDIDLDESGNLYLALDIRGVSTFLGIMKTDSDGNILWAKQIQGEANDRNNISCVRYISGYVYLGGRGAFTNYDVSQFGDGCLFKLDQNGTILKQYNYFTGDVGGERCGERIEAILSYNGNLIIAGETWPEADKIAGKWYIPGCVVSNLNVGTTNLNSVPVTAGIGVSVSRSFSETFLSTTLYNPNLGTQGSADVILFSVSE